MENKSELLKLVEACVDNKKFYGTNNKERIEWPGYWNNGKFLYTTNNRTCGLNNYKDDHKKQYSVGEFLEVVKNFNFQEYKKTIELHIGLTINFDDLPPITISIKSQEDVKKISEFSINEIKWGFKKSWNFFKEKKSIQIPTGNKIVYEIKETKTEYYYEITSGSIKENISISEVDKMIEKYKENLIKFKKLLDEEKIKERFERYSKNDN